MDTQLKCFWCSCEIHATSWGSMARGSEFFYCSLECLNADKVEAAAGLLKRDKKGKGIK